MRSAFSLLLLLFSFSRCHEQLPPVSKFNINEIAFARAAIFKWDTEYVLDSLGRYGPSVLDSVELDEEAVQAVVRTLLAGESYDLLYTGDLCHDPHFMVQAFDKEGRQSNFFTICFKCRNVRMTNYRKYPKHDELTISPEGEAAFLDLQDRLFPDYKGSFFWDSVRYRPKRNSDE